MSFWIVICTFTNLTTKKFKILKKWKKTPGDVILYMCTINENHMMYGSWDMERDRHNFLSLWTIFCPFTPLTTRKVKILKKWNKNPGDIIILYMRTKNHDHMLYCSWDMAHDRCNCYFSFWVIFLPFYPLNNLKNQNFEKMKRTLDILSFYTCVP